MLVARLSAYGRCEPHHAGSIPVYMAAAEGEGVTFLPWAGANGKQGGGGEGAGEGGKSDWGSPHMPHAAKL